MRYPGQDIIAGNIYDKEHTANPIARWLLRNYDQALLSLLDALQPNSILDVGCGDGFILEKLRWRFPSSIIMGLDLSLRMLAKAQADRSFERIVCASADELPFGDAGFDLVICLEVLEHVQNPGKTLQHLQRVCREFMIFSVPHEPIWRVLNMLRGAYWRDLGDTPGHIQHWRPREFIHLLTRDLQVMEVLKPFPWVMALCRP